MRVIFFFVIVFWCGAEAASRCATKPCKNGGTCNKKGPAICDCPDYVEGEFCEKRRCDSNPCQNGGTCKNDGPYICLCPEYVKGELCEESPCSSNPCSNETKCTVLNYDEFECICPDGYSGDNCQINTNTGTSSSSTQSYSKESKETSEEIDSKKSEYNVRISSGAYTATISGSLISITDHSKKVTSGIPTDDRLTTNSSAYLTSETEIANQTSSLDSSSIVSTAENMITTKPDEISTSISHVTSDISTDGTPATYPTSYSTSENNIKITSEISPSNSSSTVDSTENMTTTTPDEISTSTSHVTSDIFTDGIPVTDPTTYSTSENNTEITNETSPSDSSSTVSTTENMTNRKSDEIPTFTSHVTSDVFADSTPITNPTTYTTSKNNVEITNETLPSDSSSTVSSTENITITKSNKFPTGTETTPVNIMQENKTNLTTTIKIAKLSTNSKIFSISTSLFSNKRGITTPISDMTIKTSEQLVTGITEYTTTEDEFKISEKNGGKFSTISNTVEIKEVSEESTSGEVSIKTSKTINDEKRKDDTVRDQISDKTSFSSSTAWAIGGSLLAAICLVSSGVYIVRKYRRSKCQNTGDYDANSFCSERSDSSQNIFV